MAKYTPGDTTTEYVAPTVETYGPQSNEVVPTTPREPLESIFIRRLDELHQFVLGRWPDNTDAGRRKFIIDIVKLFENIAKASPKTAKIAIQHYIANIMSAPNPYMDSTYNSPLFKPSPPRGLNIDRYYALMELCSGIATEFLHSRRYFAGRDLSYILREWPVKQRTTLISVLTSIARR